MMITTECMITDLPKEDAGDMGGAGGGMAAWVEWVYGRMM